MSTPRLPWEEPSSHVPHGGEQERADLDAATAAVDERPAWPTREEFLTDAELGNAVESAGNVVRDVIQAQSEGKDVVVSTVNMSGQQIKLTDAKNRAMRTLLQNLSVDVLVALGTVFPMLLNMDFTDKAAWLVFGASVTKTVVAVLVSYVSRLAVDPVLPTPVETVDGTVVQPVPLARRAKG